MRIPDSIPPTLTDAIRSLKDALDPSDMDFLLNHDEHTVDGLHFSVGMNLRNHWGLWHRSLLARWFETHHQIVHADDMSGILLTTLHREVNNKPWEIDEQVKPYKEHWKRLGFVNGVPPRDEPENSEDHP